MHTRRADYRHRLVRRRLEPWCGWVSVQRQHPRRVVRSAPAIAALLLLDGPDTVYRLENSDRVDDRLKNIRPNNVGDDLAFGCAGAARRRVAREHNRRAVRQQPTGLQWFPVAYVADQIRGANIFPLLLLREIRLHSWTVGTGDALLRREQLRERYMVHVRAAHLNHFLASCADQALHRVLQGGGRKSAVSIAWSVRELMWVGRAVHVCERYRNPVPFRQWFLRSPGVWCTAPGRSPSTRATWSHAILLCILD